MAPSSQPPSPRRRDVVAARGRSLLLSGSHMGLLHARHLSPPHTPPRRAPATVRSSRIHGPGSPSPAAYKIPTGLARRPASPRWRWRRRRGGSTSGSAGCGGCGASSGRPGGRTTRPSWAPWWAGSSPTWSATRRRGRRWTRCGRCRRRGRAPWSAARRTGSPGGAPPRWSTCSTPSPAAASRRSSRPPPRRQLGQPRRPQPVAAGADRRPPAPDRRRGGRAVAEMALVQEGHGAAPPAARSTSTG